MLESPFEILSCSWPRPVKQANNCWTSEPEWNAPLMPTLPQFKLELREQALFWKLDWRELFREGIRRWNPYMGGDMPGFHIVFKIRPRESGKLVFWDDDGSIIRRNGKILHLDRSAHPLARHEFEVEKDDILEIAQWQLGWDWLWTAQLQPSNQPASLAPLDLVMPWLRLVQLRLRHPNGPPLKMYTNGSTPVRTIAAIYSLILRGYAPTRCYLFGSEQWNETTHRWFESCLPFAETISKETVMNNLRAYGGGTLADLARRYWFVMKTCVSLLCSPDEACLMDDDVFILDSLGDALNAFQTHDLVYSPDQDLGQGYINTWAGVIGRPVQLRTHRFNAGLYWVRNNFDKRWLAQQMLKATPNPDAPFLWEQGFIAGIYANRSTLELPHQRYLFPLFDGLPSGMFGYDYARNPCGFASIHYGGLAEKPSDGLTLQLLSSLLGRDNEH